MNWLQKISMPIMPDYMGDLFYVQNSAPKGTKVVVYHGTTSKRLAKILQHGSFDPEQSGIPENKSYQGSSPGIYVTTSLGLGGAELYAHHAATGMDTDPQDSGDGGDPLVLELVVPIHWIEPDPDDSRLNTEGKPNEASQTQGRILRPISIRNIRQVFIKNSILAQAMPSKSSGMFEELHTEWLPIGKMMDGIQKLVKSEADLPEEYYEMVGQRPRGLSRHEPYPDYEQQLAEQLVMLHDTFLSPNYGGDIATFDAALKWIYKNGGNGDAEVSLQSFIEEVNPGSWQIFEESYRDTDYAPRPGESLSFFLRRVS